MKDWFTPPGHIHFEAKKLFGERGRILDGSVAHIAPGGGGPVEPHTHKHNHLFIVMQGEAKILLGDRDVLLQKDEAYLVEGQIPHAVWNPSDGETVMIGLSVE